MTSTPVESVTVTLRSGSPAAERLCARLAESDGDQPVDIGPFRLCDPATGRTIDTPNARLGRAVVATPNALEFTILLDGARMVMPGLVEVGS